MRGPGGEGRNNIARRLFLLGWIVLAAIPGRALCARIGLNPLMGDGAPGRNTVLTGTGFVPGAAYNLFVGGYPALPTAVNADGAGTIAPVLVALPPLPAGFHDVLLVSTAWSVTFTGAYRVTPNICVSPIVGDGRAGQTWLTNAAMRTGSWVGMVLEVEGTGLTAGATVFQDSILVGGTGTRHPAILVPASGRLQSTTVIVTDNMSSGFKDIVISDGMARTFTGAYSVRRSIGLSPARGTRDAGTQVTVEGWGFTDGTVAQILIGGLVANYTAPVNIVRGHFIAVTTLSGKVGNGLNDVVINDGVATAFPGTFYGKQNISPGAVALSPVVYSGAPNQAFLIQGLGAMTDGAIQGITINEGGTLRSTVTQPGITVNGGTFPATWIKADSPVPNAANQVTLTDVGGGQIVMGVDVQRSICLCPVTGNGAAGWTVSVTGFGFAAGTTLVANTVRTITVGGSTTWHATTAITDGSFGPLAATVSAPLAFGPQNVVVTDALIPESFRQLFRVWRSIGLSAVAGKGAAGETTGIIGTGFTGGSGFAANSITVGGLATTHLLMTVNANGWFSQLMLALPALSAGPKDVGMPFQEVFPQSYRVYNPLVSVSKYRDPPTGLKGASVTWSFSFTNTGYAGDSAVTGMTLVDTLPAGMAYAALSATSTIPSTVNWYHSGCACWTGLDAPASDVLSIKWTLTSPLPTGASGYASFRVTVQ